MAMISLDTFLDIGAMALKQHMMTCKLTSDSVYHFAGGPLPPRWHRMSAWSLISRMVRSGAYPGPNGKWIAASNLSSSDRRVLADLEDADLVEKFSETQHALSEQGIKYLQRSRETHGYRHIFLRRTIFLPCSDIHARHLLKIQNTQTSCRYSLLIKTNLPIKS